MMARSELIQLSRRLMRCTLLRRDKPCTSKQARTCKVVLPREATCASHGTEEVQVLPQPRKQRALKVREALELLADLRSDLGHLRIGRRLGGALDGGLAPQPC